MRSSATTVTATALVLAFVAGSLAAPGCSSADATARVAPIGPARASFAPVSRMLVAQCGSLDCHGNTHRNLRLYGFGGLRLHDDMTSPAPDDDVERPNEVRGNYEAVIGLEPELTSVVVRELGAAPERLTLVRKGRGEEQHAGGNAIRRGDDADRCLVSWLSSRVDEGACVRAR